MMANANALVAGVLLAVAAPAEQQQQLLHFELGPEVVQPQLSSGPAYQFPDAALAFLGERAPGAGKGKVQGTLLFPSDGATYRSTGADLLHQGRPDPSGPVLGNGPNNSYDMNGNWMLAAFRLGGDASQLLVGFTHVENHQFNCTGGHAEWNAAAVVRSTDDGRSWSREGLAVGDPQPCKPTFGGSGYASVLRQPAPAPATGDPNHGRVPGGARGVRGGAAIVWRGWGGCHGYASADPAGAAGTWKRFYEGGFTEPGVGGRETCLPGLGPNVEAPIVHWNTYLRRYVMTTNHWGKGAEAWAYTSTDGVVWGPPTLLLNASNHTASYPQVIGAASSHSAGQEATLVYAGNPPSVKGAHRDFITRTIRFVRGGRQDADAPTRQRNSTDVLMAYCYGGTNCTAPCTESSAMSGSCTNTEHEGRPGSFVYTCAGGVLASAASVMLERFAGSGCEAKERVATYTYTANVCYPDAVTGGGTTHTCSP